MIKFLTFLLLVCSVFYVQAELTPEQIAKLKQHNAECVKITGISPDLVTKARQGNFVEDEKLKNHFFCLSKKIGFQNEEGKLQPDVLRLKVGAALGNPTLANSLIDECAKELANGQETAFQTIKCYYEKTPTHIIIV